MTTGRRSNANNGNTEACFAQHEWKFCDAMRQDGSKVLLELARVPLVYSKQIINNQVQV